MDASPNNDPNVIAHLISDAVEMQDYWKAYLRDSPVCVDAAVATLYTKYTSILTSTLGGAAEVQRLIQTYIMIRAGNHRILEEPSAFPCTEYNQIFPSPIQGSRVIMTATALLAITKREYAPMIESIIAAQAAIRASWK